MIPFFFSFVLLFFGLSSLSAQDGDAPIPPGMHPAQDAGFVFAVKGGPTMASQRWNATERNILPSYHAGILLESASDWREANSIWLRTNFGAWLGYHRKGSAIRVQYQDPANLNNVIRDRIATPFHALALNLHAKGQFWHNPRLLSYYGIGAHLTYTVAHDTSMFLLDKRYVNKFNYGLWIAGGVEISLGKKAPVSLILEASITPDISRQVFIPPGIPIQFRDVGGTVQNYSSQEQRVTNLIFEISVGFKFLKPKYEYIEE